MRRRKRGVVVSHALPKLYALSRDDSRRYSPPGTRRLAPVSCALSLSAPIVYSCYWHLSVIATGMFHVAAPPDAHHHHAGSAAHQHAAPDAHPASAVPDICDIVHQICTALVLSTVSLPTLVLPQSPSPVQIVRASLIAHHLPLQHSCSSCGYLLSLTRFIVLPRVTVAYRSRRAPGARVDKAECCLINVVLQCGSVCPVALVLMPLHDLVRTVITTTDTSILVLQRST